MKNIKMKFIFTGIFLLLVQYSLLAQDKVDSLRIKIGQMIMVGFSGTSVSADDPILTEIRNGEVGGVIMFEKNIADSNSFMNLAKLNLTLQQAAPTPIFLAIDQEGGKVNRLKTKYGFPKSVTAEYLGRLDNEDTTRFYASATAKVLRQLHFNVNFAPVLDLATNPNNPVIVKYGRSFGADPKLVYKHAEIVVQEHNKEKVITAGKHFPGHGSSQSDTHFGIADVTNSWDKSELIPYKNLIKQDILPGVMSAHIVNVRLEPDSLPGTLSKNILQGMLRNKLGFEGIIFSDDMQMHAITEHYGLEKALELGINAGLDVVIFSNNIQNSESRTVKLVHEIITQLVQEGKISRDRIDQAYARIMKIKQQYLYGQY
jgi:beta-N-acetylhexosaminidase